MLCSLAESCEHLGEINRQSQLCLHQQWRHFAVEWQSCFDVLRRRRRISRIGPVGWMNSLALLPTPID